MIADRLKKGDTIGIISPSHLAGREWYANVISKIKAFGFNVKESTNLYSNTYGYSSSEAERADDFNEMIADDEVKMIFFGGGEGAEMLLPLIDYENIKKHPKIICSYSDGTSILNPVYAMTGIVTYYGQDPGIFRDLRHYDHNQFFSNFVDGNVTEFVKNSEWHTCNSGACEGVLSGGYTRNFALLLGSRYFPYNRDEKYLLFLEDHECFGKLNRVNSLISHIEQNDFINNVTGLIFGNYSDTVNPEILQMLERFGKAHKVPVVYNDDFGHGVNHAVLPIGVRAKLDADKKSLYFM